MSTFAPREKDHQLVSHDPVDRHEGVWRTISNRVRPRAADAAAFHDAEPGSLFDPRGGGIMARTC